MRILNNIVAAILLLISNILEIYFVWLIVSKPNVSNNYLFLVHFIASIIVVIALLISRLKYVKEVQPEKIAKSAYITDVKEDDADNDKDIEIVRHPILLPAFTLCFFLPIFGVFVATFLAILMKPIDGKDSDVFQEYIDYIRYNPSKRPRFSKIDINTEVFNNLEIEPVADLLKTKERTIIWGSVENLSKRSDRIAVNLIRQTMSKNDMDIKYLSSLSLDKIEASYSKNIEKIKKRIATTNKEEDYIELFEQIDKFYGCGILPEALSTKLMLDSLLLVNGSINFYPTNYDILGYRGRFLKYSSNFNESYKLFAKLYAANNLPQKFFVDAAELYAQNGKIDIASQLMEIFTKNPNNQSYLDEISSEVELDDLRAFWTDSEGQYA